MKQLLLFLSKYSSFFVLIAYVLLSLGLMFRFNSYQQSVYLSSCNYLSGQIYSVSGALKAFLGSSRVNQDLAERNAELANKILNLEERIRVLSLHQELNDSTDIIPRESPYNYKTALVINNSVSRLNNYITLDKGSKDGIAEEMGVVSHNGVVGIVEKVSDHFSVVLPILNTKLRISCKVLGSNYFGSLVWDGEDPQIAVLEELPRHVDFVTGDTIVTSGYSTVFPEGLMVGVIQEYKKARNDNFFSLKVKLSTDFSSLRYVRILNNSMLKEQKGLEKQVGITQ